VHISRVQASNTRSPVIYSGLPARDTRIAEMQKAIQELAPINYSSTDEFPRIQDEVLRLLQK
jgi:hypothetical protein